MHTYKYGIFKDMQSCIHHMKLVDTDVNVGEDAYKDDKGSTSPQNSGSLAPLICEE